MEKFIAYYDYLLLLPYTIIFFLIARRFAKKKAKSTNELYMLLINWWIKMAAGVLYIWMFVYYYGGGDFVGYKKRSDALLNSILKDWGNIKYIFLPVESFTDYLASHGYPNMKNVAIEIAYYTENNFMTSRIGCISAFFTFNRFLITGLIFSNIAYYGSVYIYLASKRIIQGYDKALVIGCLFIPSCVFWGNGWAKEPLCVLALGIIFSCSVKLFFEKKISFKTILSLAVFSFFLWRVKDYIFWAFLLALVFWIFYDRLKGLLGKNILARIYFLLFAMVLIVAIPAYFSHQIVEFIAGSVGDVIKSNVRAYEGMASATQSGGSLIQVKDIDFSSFTGIIKFIPQGIINVFFRPFPWEITNVLMIFTVLENLFFIFIFMKVFIKTRFFTKNLGIQNNYQAFAIVFSLVLAFIIGISTFNFGSMVRYKIPLLPFWASFLLIMNKKLSVNKELLVRESNTS